MLKNPRLALAPALIVFLLAPSFAAAAIPLIQPNVPFGGKITKIQACQSPAGFILHIGPPKGGKYFLNPDTTIINRHGVIEPGVWTLGSASPAPINCNKGNPDSIGGFSIGGLLDGAIDGGLLEMNVVTMEMIEPGSIFGSQIVGVEIVGAEGTLFIGGDLGLELAGLADLGGFLPGIGIISSLIGGDFLGAGLTLLGLFDPTGIIAVTSLVFNLLDINFGKKPPSLGSAYPIIRIGTGPAPASILSPPLLTPI